MVDLVSGALHTISLAVLFFCPLIALSSAHSFYSMIPEESKEYLWRTGMYLAVSIAAASYVFW